MRHTTTLVPFSARFREALGVLCTKIPPVAMCIAWLDSESEELQEFVLDHLRIEWAQGIETIDAAHAIAENCEEGRPELLSYGEERAARLLAAGPVQLKRGKVPVESRPANVSSDDFLSLWRNEFALRDEQSRLHLAEDVLLPA